MGTGVGVASGGISNVAMQVEVAVWRAVARKDAAAGAGLNGIATCAERTPSRAIAPGHKVTAPGAAPTQTIGGASQNDVTAVDQAMPQAAGFGAGKEKTAANVAAISVSSAPVNNGVLGGNTPVLA